MKESMWGYAILALGVMIISFMLLVQNLTSTSEEDFYLAREVLEASMYDAVDYGTFADSGKLVMSEQKFVEVFLRRFAESVTNNKDYTINFYDIHEYPPKATVTISTSTGEYSVLSDDVDINTVTYLNAILETTINKEATIKPGSILYTKDGTNFEVTEEKTANLIFGYLSEKDSCGYYKNIEDGKMVISKLDGNESGLEEYCYVSFDKDNDNNYNNYYVNKKDLTFK